MKFEMKEKINKKTDIPFKTNVIEGNEDVINR